uniref:Uncharacterized protein MANES_04G131200 n=1 Tax=Rhizophora mucronata TaxID=61149 RepID=A0A2P2P239_RHIMU
MASSLCSTLPSSPIFLRQKPISKTLTTVANTYAVSIRCGPRSKRGPLVKGRILSTEAILALQSLKRAHAKSPSSASFDPSNLSRLIRSDLIAVLRELLRQNLPSLALRVLSVVRSEYPGQIDLNLYADVISCLSRNGWVGEIDRLIAELEGVGCGGVQWESDKGLMRVLRGVAEAGSRDATVRICGLMRRCGCGDTWTADEYAVKVLSKGLRKMGEEKLAGEVEREFGGVSSGVLEKSKL